MHLNGSKPKRGIPINCQTTNSLLIKIIVWILLIHCSTVQMILYCIYKRSVRIASNFITDKFYSFITYKTIFNNNSFYIQFNYYCRVSWKEYLQKIVILNSPYRKYIKAFMKYCKYQVWLSYDWDARSTAIFHFL